MPLVDEIGEILAQIVGRDLLHRLAALRHEQLEPLPIALDRLRAAAVDALCGEERLHPARQIAAVVHLRGLHVILAHDLDDLTRALRHQSRQLCNQIDFCGHEKSLLCAIIAQSGT